MTTIKTADLRRWADKQYLDSESNYNSGRLICIKNKYIV